MEHGSFWISINQTPMQHDMGHACSKEGYGVTNKKGCRGSIKRSSNIHIAVLVYGNDIKAK